MERQECELDADSDHHEAERNNHRAGFFDGFEPNREIGNIECAGHLVKQADADQQKRRADRAHDQIREGGHQCAAIAAERDQDVSRERCDLEEDKGVEHVAGDRNAEESRQTQKEGGVEEVLAPLLDLAVSRADRQHHGGDHRNDHQYKCIGDVDCVLDPERPSPIAKFVHDGANVLNLSKKRK